MFVNCSVFNLTASRYNVGMTNLRKVSSGGQLTWTKDELRAGFMAFYEAYNRFPTSHEIDAYEYLPSARSIQRSYGGLVSLRKELFPDSISNYTLGAHRSESAKRTFKNGRDLEALFFTYLTTQFLEIAVHEHKLIRPGNVSSDFFIYLTPKTGVVIDVFYADSIINFINVINIKLKRYILVTEPTYLVIVGNDNITQELINSKVNNRKIPLPGHISLFSEVYFKESIVPYLKEKSEYRK